MSSTIRQEVNDRLSEASQRSAPLDAEVYREASPSTKSANDSFLNRYQASQLVEEDNDCSMSNIMTEISLDVLEVAGYTVLFCLPALMTALCTSDDLYNPFKIKYGEPAHEAVMTAPMEFLRYSILTALVYGCHVFLNTAARVIPLWVRRSWRILRKPFPDSLKMTIAGWRAARSYVCFAAFACCCVALFDTWIYHGSALAALSMGLNSLAIQQGFTSSGQLAERLLLSFSALSFLLLICKVIMHFITQAYRKTALATRITESNRKYYILARFVRLCALGNIDARSSLNRELLRQKLHHSEADELVQLAPDTAGLNLKDEASARLLANRLWAHVCPSGRDYIMPQDLRRFYSDPEEASEAFATFDELEAGLVNSRAFEAAVVGFWKQRSNLHASIINGDATLGILSNALVGAALLIWIYSVMWLFNQNSLGFAFSLGTFALSFTFLFQATAKLIFDCFVFILATHPYDVGDAVMVDKNMYRVAEIRLFSTILRRESDGGLAYFPNGSLSKKSICNPERSGIAIDAMLVTLPASTSLQQLARLQSLVRKYLQDSFASFTGSVTVLPIEMDGSGSMNVRVECKFGDADEIERDARIARKEVLSHKIEELLAMI